LKLGRLPSPPDDRNLRLATYLPPVLDTPPAVDWTPKAAPPAVADGTRYGMMLNDQIGCCAIAAPAHRIQVVTGNAGAPFTPPDADVLAAYRDVSGYDPAYPATDVGCNMLAALKYLRKRGIAGHAIGAYVAIDPQRLDHVRFAINHLLAVYVGLRLPASAKAQIGGLWDAADGRDGQPGTWGGHAVIASRYDWSLARNPRYLVPVITWGAEQLATDIFILRYCDEMWGIVSLDMLNGVGQNPLGGGLADLQADLRAVAA
jgi:hypothetical protein